MANKSDKKLGRQLLETLDSLTALIEVTHDPERLKELNQQSTKLSKQIGQLVEARLDSASAEYLEATRGLVAASAAIRQAMKGIDSVVNAIAAVSQAIDLVAEVAT